MKSVLDSQFRKNKSVMQEHLAHKHLKSSLKKISEPMLAAPGAAYHSHIHVLSWPNIA